MIFNNLTLEEEEALSRAMDPKEQKMDESEVPNESDSAKIEPDLPGGLGENGTSPLLQSALKQRADEPVMVVTRQVVEKLKDIEDKLKGARKSYYDPTRITVPTSNGAVITQVFTRNPVSIPKHIMFPKPAIVKGKPLQVGTVKTRRLFDREGNLVDPGRELPIYAVAGPDGEPLRDERGEYLVIDPQTGAVRQKLVKTTPVKRNWLRVKWALFKTWLKSFRLDLKIIKRV